MAKSRKPKRVNNKNAKTAKQPLQEKNLTKKVSGRRTRNSKKAVSSSNESSDTSPFKGFVDGANDKENKFNETGSNSTEYDKNIAFDRLVNPNYKPTFAHKNIKTYCNKNKPTSPMREKLLQFQDVRNRNNILEWLHDTRNSFDRCTQTQSDPVNDDTFIPSLDMPSVSQVANVQRHSDTKTIRKRRRSSYKLRARSLEIQIKKNGYRGRSSRHSLAGDSPMIENYHIEEVATEEEFPVPADKIFVDLLEDEYLNNIEIEVMHHEGRKILDKSGWNRIRDFNESMKVKKRQPKQLDITLKTSPCKERGGLAVNKSYDLDVMENYFVDEMTKLLEKPADPTLEEEVSHAWKLGNEFIQTLTKIDTRVRTKLLPLIDELKGILKSNNTDVFTQTDSFKCDKKIQAFASSVAIQTDECHTKKVIIENVSEASVGVQTHWEKSLMNKSIQVIAPTADIEMQTSNNLIQNPLSEEEQGSQKETLGLLIENAFKNTVKEDEPAVGLQTYQNESQCIQEMPLLIDTEVQTIHPPTPNFLTEKPPSSSKTPSDAFIENEMVRIMSVTESKNEELSETFDNMCFDTEDFVSSKIKDTGNFQNMTDCLLISVKDTSSLSNNNKGIKRLPAITDEKDINPPKRPCTKFIDTNLSVAFDTNPDGIENDSITDATIISDDENGEENHGQHCLPPAIPKTNTQQDIERYEDLIYNATKNKHHKETTIVKDDNPVYDKHPSKLEEDLEYFEAITPPRQIRRSLFNSEPKKESFSESLFSNDKHVTVVEDKTLTSQNVGLNDLDKASSEADEEVQMIMERAGSKINILQNYVLKEGVNSDARDSGNLSEDSDATGFDDADIVDATPQKVYWNREEERAEANLDVTLPPPLEFQDSEKKLITPTHKRRPLADVNKITSTPLSNKRDSEKFLTLSPISLPNHHPVRPIEIAQQSKFSPLTIVKKPASNISTKQSSILNYIKSSQGSQENATPQQENVTISPKNKPCIACSRLNKEQVIAISSMTNKKLATYSSTFTSKVTHLIVSVNSKKILKDHTIKFVTAVAAGIWILSFEWVQQCLLENRLVPEAPYEVYDVSGVPGPKTSRLTRTRKPLLRGYMIYAAPPFVSTTQKDIETVVTMLGGKVVPLPDDLLYNKGRNICLIVTEARATQDFELYEAWLEALRVATVDIEWLSRSVGQYKIQSLRPFTLCSDDTLESLGYPEELVVNVSSSFSQSVPSS